MPCRKSRPSRHPTFSSSTMDSSDDDDDDISIYESRGVEPIERLPSPQRELPLDLSVRTVPEVNIQPPTDYSVLRKDSRIVSNVDEGFINDVIHDGRYVMLEDNSNELGPPHFREPYLELSMPLDLKYMNNAPAEDTEEPQDLSLRSRCPPTHYTSSPSSSSSSSSSPSFNSGHAHFMHPNGIRVTTRYSSDPHLRHHKRERLEEMVNHIRRCSARPIPAVGDPSALGSLQHLPSNAIHPSVKRSVSCSNLPPQSYLHRHRHPGVTPSVINPASHERLLACLAQPPLRNPVPAAGNEVTVETESTWRPEDIFDLSDSGDKKPHSGQFPVDPTGQKLLYPPQQHPHEFLLQRFMSSSLSLMTNSPDGSALLRHFSHMPPSYISWMAYNYYAQLIQMGASAPRNGSGSATAASGMPTSPISPSSPVISTKVETPSPATTVTEDSKSDHALSPPSFSPNAPMSDIPRKRAPRALTGKHVKHGTGASPSTLLTLRQKIEQRQRIRQVVGDHRPPQRGRLPPNKRKLTST